MISANTWKARQPHRSSARNVALLLTASVLICGCAGSKKIAFSEAFDEQMIDAEIVVTGPIDISNGDVTERAARRSAAVVQAGILYTRSFQIDPINRPVSNALSLGSYALKSTSGLLRRIAIGAAQFPNLEYTPVPLLANEPGMDLQEWEKELDRITGRKASRGTIRFLVGGEEYFSRMLDTIEGAKESIDIRTYIFDNDDYAVRIADKLKEKSQGTDVRVMVDGLGNLMAVQADPESLPDDHNAPLSIELYMEQDSKVRVRTLSNPWLTGDHTKSTIIDGKTAFVGGMNIGREYRYEWHDLMMEVQGPIVDVLQRDTEKAWAKASILGDVANLYAFLFKHPKRAGDDGYPVRALYTKNFDSQIYRAQLAAIRRASNYIWIENAYFSDDTILYELAKARRRGVDVRVILPDAGNHASLHASNKLAINRMLKNGIRVFRYPGMNHVKAAVIDGWLCVGSANFDKLSLHVNKELNLSTSHPAAVNELLDRVFLPDFARSIEITDDEVVTIANRLTEIWVDEML
jgi:cardiolipin synthase